METSGKMLLPPDPIEVKGARYIFTPPPEYERLVEEMVERLLPPESPLPGSVAENGGISDRCK